MLAEPQQARKANLLEEEVPIPVKKITAFTMVENAQYNQCAHR